MFNAINNARDFVLVAGWSVWTELSLIRDDEEWKKRSHLGNLLKRKADEGERLGERGVPSPKYRFS